MKTPRENERRGISSVSDRSAVPRSTFGCRVRTHLGVVEERVVALREARGNESERVSVSTVTTRVPGRVVDEMIRTQGKSCSKLAGRKAKDQFLLKEGSDKRSRPIKDHEPSRAC